MSRVVRPYGDATGDGMVQVSFTLPIPHDRRAEGAAAQLARKMGIDPAIVVHARAMGPDFTFFVVYGRVNHLVELDQVPVVERDYPLLTPKEVNSAIKGRLHRPLVVVGACIGTDAHTVGIDAILNIKGFAGEKGLELERALGSGNKLVADNERETVVIQRRCLRAARAKRGRAQCGCGPSGHARPEPHGRKRL